MNRPRFSVWPSPQRDWNELRELAAWADRGDWHCVWFADHFMPNTEDGSVADGPVLECWSAIAALAAVTERVRLGSLVSPTTVRHPAVLANTAATIDRVSNGRLTLGLGAGWQVNEHRAYGFDLLEPRSRVDRFEEAIRIVAGLLAGGRFDFDGEHFRIVDAPCDPRPVQDPLPLMVGTGGPRMLRITVGHAHEWNAWGTPETTAPLVDRVDAACAAGGRDPATLHRSVQALFFLVDDPDTAERIRAVAPPDRSVIGDASHIRAVVERYAAQGFDEIIVPDFVLGDTAEQRRAGYERFHEAVIA